MKKRFLALVACFLTITYSGCGLARFENLTHRFDDAIGNDLASAVGDAIDK